MMKVNKQRLSQQVYDIIKEMIAAHRFQPGTRLNIEQLTKEVGASRTPVWEAVHRLMQEGILENIPHRGVFMVALTPRMALELYTVREALEGLAARLAVQNITEKMLKRMMKCLYHQYRVIQKEDLVGYSKLDFEFHSIIYEACGNQVLQEMLEAVKNKMRPLSMHITPLLSLLYRDHCEILEAFTAKDPERAERAFRCHNRQMIEQIKAQSEGEEWKKVESKESAASEQECSGSAGEAGGARGRKTAQGGHGTAANRRRKGENIISGV